MLSSERQSSRFSNAALGFTLIELLVVVAIGAILIALTVVNVPKILLSSKMTQATTNLKRISEGIATYAAENNAFPYSGINATDGGSPTELWTATVLPYLPDQKKLVKIGRNDQPLAAVYLSPLLPQDKHGTVADFGVNGAVLLRKASDAAANSRTTSPISISSVPRPSQTIMVMTAQSDTGGGSWYVGSSSYVGNINYQLRPSDHGTGKLIAAFVDGHVETIKFDDFVLNRRAYLLPNP